MPNELMDQPADGPTDRLTNRFSGLWRHMQATKKNSSSPFGNRLIGQGVKSEFHDINFSFPLHHQKRWFTAADSMY